MLSTSDLKTFALESALGRAGIGAAFLARGLLSRDPFRRASRLLRAWRGSGHPLVVKTAVRELRSELLWDGQPKPLAENPLFRSFAASPAAAAVRRQFAEYPIADRVRLRFPRQEEDPLRQGDLILLKAADPAAGERGALLVKYNDSIARFPALFQIERLVQEYVVILEPSWWGYQDAAFFVYVGSDADVVVQAQAETDFRFIKEHGLTLTPTRLGAGDWVDPSLFSPTGVAKAYDLVMVSSWNPFKRHRDLFAALREAREEHGIILTTALVGYPNGWDAAEIQGQVKEFGLADQCEIYNEISPAQVAEVITKSRLYILLSRREGANKAMYEAMFCDTPVLAPSDHRGINHAHLNPRTGRAFDRARLADELIAAVRRAEDYSPRSWALDNTGYAVATHRLDELLAELATRRGNPWSSHLVPKMNQPNLRYASEADRLRLDSEYDRLVRFLRPVD
jgi:glycosyltransferase involved in cell wall biosynthesis